MITLNLQLRYEGKIDNNDMRTKLEGYLQGTEFEILSIDKKDHSQTPLADENNKEYKHHKLPSQPEGAAPDVNTSGAGGMVSPETDDYSKN
ncbi:hypothetical protein ACQCVH_12100 [Bacillus infantis]|uniref:hypothetical protein n=1 Tax=Bacillus infantis TaxID=324767 RepID=UPI003CF8C767